MWDTHTRHQHPLYHFHHYYHQSTDQPTMQTICFSWRLKRFNHPNTLTSSWCKTKKNKYNKHHGKVSVPLTCGGMEWDEKWDRFACRCHRQLVTIHLNVDTRTFSLCCWVDFVNEAKKYNKHTKFQVIIMCYCCWATARTWHGVAPMLSTCETATMLLEFVSGRRTIKTRQGLQS